MRTLIVLGCILSLLSCSKQLDWGEGGDPGRVNAAAVNKWLFNMHTVDQALELLMQRGLKIHDGDLRAALVDFMWAASSADRKLLSHEGGVGGTRT